MFNKIKQKINDVFYDGYEKHTINAIGAALDYIYDKLENDDIYKNRVEEYEIHKSKIRRYAKYHVVLYVTRDEWRAIMDIIENDEDGLHRIIHSSYGFHGVYYCR